MLRRGMLLIALLALATPAAMADERIHAYHSDVTVHRDGSLTVVETITVSAEGDEIKRGIYRDFPTVRGGMFTRHRVGFTLLGAKRDGKGEHARVVNKGSFVRVDLGQESVILDPGQYTYTLTYKTTRQLGFFDDHDELYWNVTGNEWAFPIDRASATVHLPEDVDPGNVGLEAYTGAAGDKGQNYRARARDDGSYVFETTRPLPKGHGLTIVVSFPTGHVARPSRSEQITAWLAENRGGLIGLVGLVVVTGYYLMSWVRVGRDPNRGMISPEFEPPEALSPAAVRYLSRMGYDDRCLSSTVLSLAVKGFLEIEEDDDREYRLRKTDDADRIELSAEEQAVASNLLSAYEEITLAQRNHKPFQKAKKALKGVLSDRHEGVDFHSNRASLIIGVVLSAVTVVMMAISFVLNGGPEVGFMMLWLSIWTVGVIFLLRAVYMAFRSRRWGQVVRMGLFSSLFVAAEVVVGAILLFRVGIVGTVTLIGLGVINAAFAKWLKAPTAEGRRLMDRIEGFGLYLQQADPMSAPGSDHAPETFEQYLPYSHALELESAWAERFAEMLKAPADERRGHAYIPHWYHGPGWHRWGPAGFASGLGGALVGSVQSASTSPSSSGSGGGGSSGGGGGGGGGGGW